MRLEFESNSSALPHVENSTVNESVSSEGEHLLRAGVKAAQEGRRSEAKALLLRVTEVEPQNENAWLWLASISEYPEELLVFLNNVLRVNPENARAIEWKKATKSLLAKTLVQRGVDASKEQRNHFARQCFEQAVEHDSENEMAWLWLASITESEADKVPMFEKVLSINPENSTALEALSSHRAVQSARLLDQAVGEAIEGHHSNAKRLLETVIGENDSLEDAWVLKAHLAESFEERAECMLKLRALNPENEMARVCLASWRSLIERGNVRAEAETAETAVEEPVAESPAQPEAGESESTELQAVASEPAIAVAEEPESEPEAVPSAEMFNSHNDYAEPDMPTQDLRSIPSFNYPPADAEFESDQSFADQSFEDQPFDEPESGEASAQLAFEIEAEENEMSAAFSDNDLHATFTPNAESAADFMPQREESFEQSFAAFQVSEPEREEEWKNTSPEVFFGYNPEAAAQESVAAEEPSQQFDQNSDDVEVTETADMEFGEAEPSFVAEQPAEEQQFAEEQPFEEYQEPAPEAVHESFEPAFEEVQEFSAPAAQLEVSEAPELKVDAEPEKAESMLCPFCNGENEIQAYNCGTCRSALSLSDLDSLFGHDADREVLERAVESFEREHESYGLDAEKLAQLGIGHINLANYRQGYLYLQEAVKANPSNVVLDAQVNAFAIRLAELEKQQTAQESMSKNRKILVVDDSPTVRKLISSKLEKCGHEVVCAVDGLDALEKLNGMSPDLILLDITMPRMDGYQVCKLIRNNADMKDVPVVMISGKDGFFDKVRGRMAGTTDYITKPFGPETLMKTVENYLG